MSVAVKEVAAQPDSTSRLALFWASAVGKKALMAITGLVLFGFVFVHMLGNLQLYTGSEALNHYAKLLQSTKGLLWTARIVLLASVTIHAVAGIQLWMRKRSARPIDYYVKENIQGSAPSRTMIWTGLVLLAFVVFHLLHFTTGDLHPDFKHDDVFRNVVVGFQQAGAAVFYMVCMVALGMHLWHGVYSVFNSLGLTHPRYTPGVRRAAATIATLIALGNISMPIAVLAGLVR
jgi:succinate dehydrogenase / fumarate reductase, cytochrome b subunit